MDYRLKRIRRELAYKGSILDVYKDTMELPDGKTEAWDFVDHRKGGACIVPVLPDGRILVIRQYRPAIDRETVELPAGARNSAAEDTMETARRELLEETGCRAGRLSLLLKLKTAAAYCSEFTDVYLAEELDMGESQSLDEAEEIRYEAVPLSTLLEKIYAGEIQDSKTVAGILAYAARK